MNKEKTTCNRENGSTSAPWARNCWIADSVASLIQSRVEYLGRMHGGKFGADTDPDHPLWAFIEDLNRYCEEIRVKNGLREPEVVTWNPLIEWPEEV